MTKFEQMKITTTMNKTDFWNDRFAAEEYIYGHTPNAYLKEQLPKLKIGSVLFPGEGEGRNAVFAASEGWEVSAFDPSESGKKKALQLAKVKGVTLDYQISEVKSAEYTPESFDALVLIFAHFHESVRRDYHKKLASFVKKGGYIVMEAFSVSHEENQKINPNAGGPKSPGHLYTLADIEADFPDFQFIKLEETTTELKEGAYHVGKANVIRILAKKK